MLEVVLVGLMVSGLGHANELPLDIGQVKVAFSPYNDAASQILSELRSARHSVDAALFYLSHSDLIDMLCRIAAGGSVRVRLLTDAEAARPADRHILEKLSAHGVEVRVHSMGTGKMHLKCAVLDGATVITGAANWTSQAFERNIEDSIIIRSSNLARQYQAHFDALFAQASPLNSHAAQDIQLPQPCATNPLPDLRLQPDWLLPHSNHVATVYFSPGRKGPKRLGEQIAAATDSVHIAMYLLNDSSMRTILAEKARSRSAAIRLIADSGMLEGSLRPVLQELAEAGVEISWLGDDRQSLHLKTAVIDGRYVWTGSANWTPNAFDRNVEDMLCVNSPTLARTYLTFFDTLRKECQQFQPASQTVANSDRGAVTLRGGFVVGLPPTGARTNWTRALTKTVQPSFDVSGSLMYLPDDQYFPVLIELIRTARQSVLVAMFVFSEMKADELLKSQLIKALTDAARRGVYVYLLLHMPMGEGESLARAHENWAEELRAHGIDVRLHVPNVPLHTKLVVVDLAKVLIGSHNWTEGALSGERVGESSALLVLPQQDMRWADYVLGLECVSDMRSRDLWEEELRQLRQLSGLRGKLQQNYLRQLEGMP